MTLWAWALRAWSTPGVEPACLALQDHANQSVALLLWRAWCVAERRPVDVERHRAATDLTGLVETEVLRPLRSARRSVSKEWPSLGEEARQGAREQIRAAELGVERALLEALEALSADPAGDETQLTEALLSLVEDCGGQATGRPVRDLVKAVVQSLSNTPA